MLSIKAVVKFTQRIDVPKRVAELVDAEMPALALMFEARAKERTPVLTGNLKSKMIGRRSGYLAAELSNNAEYVEFVEFGTARMQPRAMMRNAGEVMQKDGQDYLEEKLKPENL
jgi:HK97 gp10 family phage protein